MNVVLIGDPLQVGRTIFALGRNAAIVRVERQALREGHKDNTKNLGGHRGRTRKSDVPHILAPGETRRFTQNCFSF